MIAILKSKGSLFLRNPWSIILMTVLTLVLAYLIGGIDHVKTKVPVFTGMNEIDQSEIWNRLIQSDIFEFTLVEEKEAKELIHENKSEMVLELEEDTYTIYVTAQTSNANLLNQHVQSIYTDTHMNEVILEAAKGSNREIDLNGLEQSLSNRHEELLFSIESNYFRGNQTVTIDNSLQAVFGFALFFVIYTISFNVVHILQEKESGVWDRMILSPLKKWQMYVGNLLYSFIIGYIQCALVFALFHYVLDFNFYGGFWKTMIVLVPYVFCIVALAMFIVSFSKSIQHFNVFIPLVSVSFAMIGGAYWPLEIVTSEFMIQLSKYVPITYGMEALKLATVYQAPLNDLLLPMSILMLFGVILMGVGINVMERRNA